MTLHRILLVVSVGLLVLATFAVPGSPILLGWAGVAVFVLAELAEKH